MPIHAELLAVAALSLAGGSILQSSASQVPPVSPLNLADIFIDYRTFGPDGRLFSETRIEPRQSSDPEKARWIATNTAFELDGSRTVRATSSDDCSELVPVLEKIAEFDVGRIYIIYISPLPAGMGPQTRDGLTYEFTTPGLTADGAHTRLVIRGSSGEVASLGQLADFQLEKCWEPATED